MEGAVPLRRQVLSFGHYLDEEEAVMIYDREASRLLGDAAVLNFPIGR